MAIYDSNQPEKSGFVYIWYDRKDKRFYIGCHWGFENDGYICSSRWMLSAYKKRTQDFKRRIIKRNIQSRPALYEEELRYLHMIKSDERQFRYYNIHITDNEVWHKYPENIKTISQKLTGRKHSSETRAKMSAVARNRSAEYRAKMSVTMKNMTSEHRAKLSIASKNMTSEHRAKISNALKGRIFSSEHRAKLSAAHIGYKHSSESRVKMSMAARNMSEEHRTKNSVAQKLRPRMSIKTREKISAAAIGRKHSLETIEKMAIAQKARRTRENI